jgi:hypothetical protein
MSGDDFRYTDEQWAAISRELRRVGVDAGAVMVDTGGRLMGGGDHADESVREVLEVTVCFYLLTQELEPRHKSEREVARGAVQLSQSLRTAVQNLRLKKQYAGYLTRTLEEFEDRCDYIFTLKFDAEEIRIDHLICDALIVYAEAIAKVFPDKA